MAHEVTLITGDGVGPELAAAARRCVDATGVRINWDVQEAGVEVMERCGTPLPEATMESVRRTRCTLKAPITTPVGTGFRSLNVHLRQTLGLLRLPSAVQALSGRANVFQRQARRSGDRPREHRRPLRGHRVRGRPAGDRRAVRLSQQDFAAADDQIGPHGNRHLDQADQHFGQRADRALRLRLRPRRTSGRRSRPSTRRTS